MSNGRYIVPLRTVGRIPHVFIISQPWHVYWVEIANEVLKTTDSDGEAIVAGLKQARIRF